MAATLTAPQIIDTRRVVGDLDQDQTKRFVTDDADVQTFFDSANGDFPTTYVIYLERLVGLAAHKISVNDAIGRQEEQQQIYEHFVERLAYWGSKSTLSGAALGVGSIDFNIDTDVDDVPS